MAYLTTLSPAAAVGEYWFDSGSLQGNVGELGKQRAGPEARVKAKNGQETQFPHQLI
jgi:hypothetical protein